MMCWWPLLRKIFGLKRFLQKSRSESGGDIVILGRKPSDASSDTAVARVTPRRNVSQAGMGKGSFLTNVKEEDADEHRDAQRDIEMGTMRVI
jgi:hypothetical protein